MREIIVCTNCRFSAEEKLDADGVTGGALLYEAVKAEAEGPGIAVRGQACLWNCTRHCSVIFRDTDRWSYVTGSFAPTQEAAQGILAWFQMHGETERGEVPFKTWPQAMRGKFIARIPPVLE